MFTLGLTGGIASGKSEAARVFAGLGVPVIDADRIARDVLAPFSPGLTRLVEKLGSEFLTPAGRLDRQRLRARSFASTELRRRMDEVTHPLILERIRRRLTTLAAPYAVVMAPLLIESGLAREMDRVLVMDCSESLQMARLMERDGETEAGARRMLDAQIPRSERLAAADDVLANDGSFADLAASVRQLHARYLRFASAS
ncbi:MAG TPA: dephospho-CoA kinase [Gammaproteobacteria bacterium]|nr:dephospho-CoA kinase [Gammaproteobacteria bacterium]